MNARGSEWRKWDLQVHSPYSVLNNGFGSDIDTYATKLLLKAIESDISAIGITDYFCIEGYKALHAIMNDDAKLYSLLGSKVEAAKKIKIFPNIEFRSSVLIDANRVNFHVIFSDEISPKDIEEQFLHDLKFTAETETDEDDHRFPLKLVNLENSGKSLKEQHAHFQDKSDLYIGMMTAVIDDKDVTSVLTNNRRLFKNKYLIAIPPDEDLGKIGWNTQGHLVRKNFIRKSHVFFSRNEATKLFGLGKKHEKTEHYLKEFHSYKPCLGTSDCHDYDTLFQVPDSKHTWIKADLTFDGLRQVMNEPEDRIFIGEEPPALKRKKQHPTKILDSLHIYKKAGADTKGDIWFGDNTNIVLNSELVAVIGNKGSGKSALADILGLLGNTSCPEFSFLNKDKFQNSKDNKAKCFEATLSWLNGVTDAPKNLNEQPDKLLLEKIKYIPQSFLEGVCNDINLGEKSQFYVELQKVIFSHIPNEELLGKATLSELLHHKGEEVQKAIDSLILELKDINASIVQYEDYLNPNYKKSLEDQLKGKEVELQAHEISKPPAVTEPKADKESKEKADAASQALLTEQTALATLDEQITATQNSVNELVKKLNAAEKSLGKIENIKRHVEAFEKDIASDLAAIEIALESVFKTQLNKQPIENYITQKNLEISALRTQLDIQVEGSLAYQKEQKLIKIAQLNLELSEPQRKFQEFQQKLKDWELAKQMIIGSAEKAGTLNFIKNQIEILHKVPDWLIIVQGNRKLKVQEIYAEKEKLKTYYSKYYGYAQQHLDSHPLAKKEHFELKFNVAISENGFASQILKLVDQRKFGPFNGKETGLAIANNMLKLADFESFEGVWAFADNLIAAMSLHEEKPISIRDQLNQNFTISDIYELVFSLNYLSPTYNLKWANKELDKLSPGERGNLLLIFYLLIDKDDTPLVIDQPEENLDNHTVFTTLVPCIKDAKKRRQIIMVTHNPNLAVVCDAEQIIHAEIEKNDGNKVVYTLGAIENPEINKRIINVLEGTRPAFDKRDARYVIGSASKS